MSSFEISQIDLEHGYRESDVSEIGEEDGSSCDYDYDFHSAVRSFCGEFEIHDLDYYNNNNNNNNNNNSQESETSESNRESPERDCRICHLGLESNQHECGDPMFLGCSCKDDLGFVHKQCAETWFKIKGNKTCEICRCIARNFNKSVNEIDQTTVETNVDDVEAGNSTIVVAAIDSDDRRFWRGKRFLNFLLTCLVSAFVISWFFHFNLP